jgi:hypothetical protein
MRPIPGAPDYAPVPPFPNGEPQPQPKVEQARSENWVISLAGTRSPLGLLSDKGELTFMVRVTLGKHQKRCHVTVDQRTAEQFARSLMIKHIPCSIEQFSNDSRVAYQGTESIFTARVGGLKLDFYVPRSDVEAFANEILAKLGAAVVAG